MIKLTREQAEAAIECPQGVECHADGMDRTFVLVDSEVMRQMQDTAAQSDRNAIQAGIDDMNAGRMQAASIARKAGRDSLTSRFSE